MIEKDEAIKDAVEENYSEMQNKYLVFNLGDEKFGVEISFIKEIIPLPEPSPIPGMKESDRGVIKLRKETIPLKDMRKLLGLPSLEEEDEKTMEELNRRKQDHINWMDELLASVEEKREFRGEMDPHKCKFGKWYDNFETDDINLSLFLVQFDTPHKQIHKLAEEIKETNKTLGFEESKKIIMKAKDKELQYLISLFDEVETHLRDSHRELAIVYKIDDNFRAVTADKVDGIEDIPKSEIQQKESISEKIPFSQGITRVNDIPVVLLDFSLIK